MVRSPDITAEERQEQIGHHLHWINAHVPGLLTGVDWKKDPEAARMNLAGRCRELGSSATPELYERLLCVGQMADMPELTEVIRTRAFTDGDAAALEAFDEQGNPDAHAALVRINANRQTKETKAQMMERVFGWDATPRRTQG